MCNKVFYSLVLWQDGSTLRFYLNILSLCYLLCPDSCSQLVGLPGVPSGQHGAQLSSHTAAGDQRSDWSLSVFTGRLRERHLQNEQLVHCNSQTAWEKTGGEHGRALQVREARLLGLTGCVLIIWGFFFSFVNLSKIPLNAPTCSHCQTKVKFFFQTKKFQHITPYQITTSKNNGIC